MIRTTLKRLYRAGIVLAAVAVSSISFAQGGLLTEISFGITSPTYAKELGVSASQIDQIEKLMRSYSQEQTALGKKNASDEAYDKLDAAYAEKIVGVLSAAQKTRLREIALQTEGPSAIARAEIAQELGLSADQRSKIAALASSSRDAQENLDEKLGEKLASIPAPKTSGKAALQAYEKQKNAALASFEDDQKRVDAQKEQNDAKILAALTPAQKSKWQQMLGKKFSA